MSIHINMIQINMYTYYMYYIFYIEVYIYLYKGNIIFIYGI